MKKILLLPLFLLFTLIASCSKENIIAQGNLVSVTRTFSDYEVVRVDDGINLIVQNSGLDFITVATSENIEPYVLTTMVDDSLSISLKGGLNVDGDYSVDVYIDRAFLDKIYGAGGANIFVTDTIATKMEVWLDGGSRLSAAVVSEKFGITLNSSSQATVSGSCDELTINGANSSQFNGTYLTTKTLNVALSNSSYVVATVSEYLNVSVASQSTLKYRGDAVVSSISVEGNGVIEKITEIEE